MHAVEQLESPLGLPCAKLTSNCSFCRCQICPGDAIFPVDQPLEGRRPGLAWLHYACASKLGGGTPPPVPECKHLARSGKCQYGDSCFFVHRPGVAAAAAERVRARRANPNAKIANRGEGRRNRVNNSSRASVLRRWLLDTFGIDALRQGSGVLDIAGGKGELAWELLNLNSVPSVVLEPRPLDFASCASKFKYGFYWRNPIFSRYLHTAWDPQQATRAPMHLRLLLEPPVVAWASGCQEPPASSEEGFLEWSQRAHQLQWTRKGLHEVEDHEESCPAGQQEQQGLSQQHLPNDGCMDLLDQQGADPGKVDDDVGVHALGDGEQVSSESEALALLRGCSVVAALHPDQAAEHAVALALALQIPFAVVPCCVYSAQFPRRRLPTGGQVRTYEDLLDYLQSMDPRIRREYLDFEGKNTVIFMTAADVASERPDPASLLCHQCKGVSE